MRRRLSPLLAALAPGAALALWLVLAVGFLFAALGPDARAALLAAALPVLESHGMIVVLWWFLAAVGAGLLARKLHARHVEAPARLAEAAGALVADADASPVTTSGAAPAQALAVTLNALAESRRALARDMAQRIESASRTVALQRDQLGALMAELQQAVVVLNLDGRILLYNARARALSTRIAQGPGGAGGAGIIGLGRSIHAVVDAARIAHARESVERHVARGDTEAAARFVTITSRGHLLQVQLAPVRAADGAAIAGFVLLLDDITDAYEAEARRDRHWLDLAEASRAALASIQAALDMLDYPDLDPADRERFQAVVREEAGALGERLAGLAHEAARDMRSRWPLQDMLGADLAAAVARRITDATGRAVATEGVDRGVWLSVDSFALVEALAALGTLLSAAGAQDLALRLSRAGPRAHLDLAWRGAPAAAGWQSAPLASGAARAGTVREVAERHGGELWLEQGRDGAAPAFRFLLPRAAEPDTPAPDQSRPAYYDFDLFAASDARHAGDDRPLAEIAYTVFDTETTGLDPAGGDEILQIGATRIVNGRILAGECFEQLVDPGRSIPQAGIAVHGIGPEAVRGKPAIGTVLPAFHAFAADTVLVGHNVAFDLRFFALKEEQCGVRFDQPVLDTLLLAAVAFPGEDSHSLEAMATRLGVPVEGRHTAPGDARTTAQLFLRLLPLLRQRGIVTLGEARAAAQASHYARLRY